MIVVPFAVLFLSLLLETLELGNSSINSRKAN